MREILQVHLSDWQYQNILAHYHFQDEALGALQQIGGLTERAAEPVLYYDDFPEQTGVSHRLAVIVTLGNGVDMLQDRYSESGKLSESYMVECIGMELLKEAYGQAAERIHAHTGRWISGFSFVGDAVPFPYMERIFDRLAPDAVSFNQAYMLTPKKTVVFLTELCTERKNSYCHVCADCGYLACPCRTEHTRKQPGQQDKKVKTERIKRYAGNQMS